MSEQGDRPAPEPSDAILTAPNAITFVRFLLIPPFLYLAITEQDLITWLIGFVVGTSDWVDGYVARRFNQVSKLGIAMDPLIDRMVVFAMGFVVIYRDLVPLWALAIVVAREAFLLAALPVIAAWKVPRPAVTFVGKAGFFCLIWGFAFFYAVTVPDPEQPLFEIVAWGFFGVGVVLGYMAAFGYLRTALASKRSAAA